MIGVKINGRLGNQLFQYAFAYNLSKELKTPFYLDTETEIIIDKYFKIRLPVYNKIIKILNFKGGRRLKAYLLRLTKIFLKRSVFRDDVHPCSLIKTIENNTFYEGFFQSRAFIIEHEKEIISLFEIKERFRINSIDFFDPGYVTVLVHVRRTDYFNTYYEELDTSDISIPRDYFYRSLDHVSGLINSPYKVYVVSDDIEYVKNEFSDSKYELNFLQNHLIVDFQLIMNAEYLILSNSTFCWWGAFLNNRVKEVIAPLYWCGGSKQKFFPSGIHEHLGWTWM